MTGGEDIVSMIQAAVQHHQSGRLGEAEVLYRQVLQVQPDNADALHLLGVLAHQAGNHEAAIELINRAIAINPTVAVFHNNCGEAYRALGKLDEALVCYKKTLALDPGFVDAHNNLGVVYQAQGNLDDAIACYEKALALRPTYAKAHNNLGFAFQQRDRLNEALESYRLALRFDPTYAQAHHNMGCVYQQQNRMQEAMASYQKALALKPDYLETLNNLGNVFLETGLAERAVANFEMIVKIMPDSAPGHAGLASAFHALGNHSGALIHYEHALRLNPNDTKIRHMHAAIGGAPAPAMANPEYVAELFDKYADKFDSHLIENLEYRTPVHLNQAIRRVFDHAAAQYDVMDLGCGTGLCGPLLRDLAYSMTGVDLSPKMIEKARERGIYDRLVVCDVTEVLRESCNAYDLIIAADVFVYIGDLVPVFTASAAALRPGGLLVFSVEAVDDGEFYVLRSTGRYAHAPDYIRTLAVAQGFEVISQDQAVLRKERGNPMHGYLFVLKKTE